MTTKQRALLDAIRTWFDTHDKPPTCAGLAYRAGYKGTGAVHRHLVALRAEGLITFEPRKWGTIALVNRCPTCGQEWEDGNVRTRKPRRGARRDRIGVQDGDSRGSDADRAGIQSAPDESEHDRGEDGAGT